MYRGVYINNHDIREYGAKLQTDYAISGYDVANATNQGPNRSSVLLLRQSFAPLHITLPLDFYGDSKAETMTQLSAFSALLTGKFEVDLGDGYQYTCILDELGPTAWINDEICSVDVSMSGFRHTDPLTVTGTNQVTVYNPGTWLESGCKITIGIIIPDSGTPVVVKVQRADKALLYTLKTTGRTTGTLVLDGVGMQNKLPGNQTDADVMQWKDYPSLAPGENTITVSGPLKDVTVTVEFIPMYL